MSCVLITGANRGIGLELVRQYADDGWDVIATCRTPAKAKDLKELAGKNKNIRVEALEATDSTSIKALARTLKDTTIDLLVNNAGILTGGTKLRTAVDHDNSQNFGSIDAEGWDKILRTNTIGPIMVTENLMPNLRHSKNPTVVMISSGWGSIELMGPEYMGYRSSKAALNCAMRNLSVVLKGQKVIVVSVSPGWVQTDMGGKEADLTPEESVTNMKKLFGKLTMKHSGQFLRMNGQALPW